MIMSSKGKLVVISGPSGVGKSTIVKEVLSRCGATFSVSATTRPKRKGEVDGKDYNFVSRDEFEKRIADGEMLEWAEVFGEYYGTPAVSVEESVADGKTVLLDIDVQGGIQVHQKKPDAKFIMIVAPDVDELASRLRGRGSENAEALKRRLNKAQEEIDTARKSGVYEFYVVNDELEKAIGQVIEIINEEYNKI